MSNPYFKKRNSQSKDKDAPTLARIPHHYFSSNEGVFKELLRYETCWAHIPNTDPNFPFAFHVALVGKDENDKCYSIGALQHNAEPNPNYKAPDVKETENTDRTTVNKKNNKKNKSQRKFKAKKSSKKNYK